MVDATATKKLEALEFLYKEATERLRELQRDHARIGRAIAETELNLRNIALLMDQARRAS